MLTSGGFAGTIGVVSESNDHLRKSQAVLSVYMRKAALGSREAVPLVMVRVWNVVKAKQRPSVISCRSSRTLLQILQHRQPMSNVPDAAVR